VDGGQKLVCERNGPRIIPCHGLVGSAQIGGWVWRPSGGHLKARRSNKDPLYKVLPLNDIQSQCRIHLLTHNIVYLHTYNIIDLSMIGTIYLYLHDIINLLSRGIIYLY